MDTFLIDPAECLILKAFQESSSLREAARLLNCDPAGLTRKAQEIANRHGLLQKVGTRWQVSQRGIRLVAWVDTCVRSQKAILSEQENLRLASTTWFSEEILIPHAKSLQEKFRPTDISVSFSVPQKSFELSLIDGSVDFVIVCHPPESPEIEHRRLGREEWVLIAPVAWKSRLHGSNLISELSHKNFIRHTGLNFDNLLPNGPKIESNLEIDNLVGVRSAVASGLGWSLVPRLLVQRKISEGKLFEVPYAVATQDRNVCIWWLRNRVELKKHSGRMMTWLKEITGP